MPRIREQLLAIPASDIVVCSIVRSELFYGSAKSQTPLPSRQKQDLFLAPYMSLSFDDRVASIYGEIRANLEKQGTPIGPLDLQIASISVAHNLILITHNTREFGRVEGLKLEDWEST